MAEVEWKIAKSEAACCLCAAQFAPGQAYYSVLVQQTEALQRQDYCASCFQAQRPENVYYFWRATQADPEAGEKKARSPGPLVDAEYVLDFFKRLEEPGANAGANGAESQRLAFRYILALMLARKKTLVFEGKSRDRAGQEVHLFRERRGGQEHRVVEPPLSAEEVAAVSAELGALLGLKPPPAPAAAAEAGQPSGGAGQTTRGITA